jgi:hypothetical protein
MTASVNHYLPCFVFAIKHSLTLHFFFPKGVCAYVGDLIAGGVGKLLIFAHHLVVLDGIQVRSFSC